MGSADMRVKTVRPEVGDSAEPAFEAYDLPTQTPPVIGATCLCLPDRHPHEFLQRIVAKARLAD